jgi:hypothetical protein
MRRHSLCMLRAGGDENDDTVNLTQVGNQAFASWYTAAMGGSQQFRLTHNRDPVPHLPPKEFGFRHQPHEVRPLCAPLIAPGSPTARFAHHPVRFAT